MMSCFISDLNLLYICTVIVRHVSPEFSLISRGKSVPVENAINLSATIFLNGKIRLHAIRKDGKV